MTYESFDTLLLTAASKLGSSAFNSPRAGSSRIVVEPLNPMPSAKHLSGRQLWNTIAVPEDVLPSMEAQSSTTIVFVVALFPINEESLGASTLRILSCCGI